MARMVKQDERGMLRYVDKGELVGMALPPGLRHFDDSKPLLEQDGRWVEHAPGTLGGYSYKELCATPGLPLPGRLQVGDTIRYEFANSDRVDTAVVTELLSGEGYEFRAQWDDGESFKYNRSTFSKRTTLIAGPSYEAAKRQPESRPVIPNTIFTWSADEVAKAMAGAAPVPRLTPAARTEKLAAIREDRLARVTPRPGQVWRWNSFHFINGVQLDRGQPIECTILDEHQTHFDVRNADGYRAKVYAKPGPCFVGEDWSFVSGPTQPETPHERRARELRLDLEWHRPEGVTRDEYVRRYTGAWERQSDPWGNPRPLNPDPFQRRAAARAAAVGGPK